jgi:hypothetical protein
MSDYLLTKQYYGVETLQHTFNLLQMESAKTFHLDLETTLNFKHQVLPTILPIGYPKILYYGFGVNGYREDGSWRTPYRPEATEQDLYHSIPFLTVPAGTHLDDGNAYLYRMKKTVTINNRLYDAYYLKVINLTNVIPKLTQIVKVNPTQYTAEDYITVPNLNPTPNLNNLSTRSPDNNGTITVTVDYVNLRLTPDEIVNITEVYYGGDISKLSISEVGLYSGEDYSTDDPDYTEAVGVQLAYKFCDTGYQVTDLAKGVQKNIRLAGANRLLL